MTKPRFIDEQMVTIHREADTKPVPDVAKKHGVSTQTIYRWRKHFGSRRALAVKCGARWRGRRTTIGGRRVQPTLGRTAVQSLHHRAASCIGCARQLPVDIRQRIGLASELRRADDIDYCHGRSRADQVAGSGARDSVGQTSGATQRCLKPGCSQSWIQRENWEFETHTA